MNPNLTSGYTKYSVFLLCALILNCTGVPSDHTVQVLTPEIFNGRQADHQDYTTQIILFLKGPSPIPTNWVQCWKEQCNKLTHTHTYYRQQSHEAFICYQLICWNWRRRKINDKCNEFLEWTFLSSKDIHKKNVSCNKNLLFCSGADFTCLFCCSCHFFFFIFFFISCFIFFSEIFK